MSSDSDKDEEEEEELVCPYTVTAGSLEEEAGTEICDEKDDRLDDRKESGGRLPRRRWSRRTCSADSVLMVKSMLDLRLLDSYCPDKPEEHHEEEEVKPHPSEGKTSPCSSSRGRGPAMEAELHKTSRELGSTVSLQVTTGWVDDDEMRTNQRPDFILLSNQSPERENPVLYPDQWDDRVSLAGCEFQVKEVRPSVSGDRQDKPSPDSGCSLGFNSRLSSPDRRPAGDDSELLSVDGNSSELEMEEEEEEEQRAAAGGGGGASSQLVPQTPDQEAFLKEHFVTLADLNASGSPSRGSHSSSESLSISSRFLSQNLPGSRAVVPLPSRTAGGGSEVKARPLVFEVRPLMEQNQNEDQHQGTEQIQNDVDQEEVSQVPRPSSMKKKIQESKRSQGPTARAAALHLNSSSGLRKTQSVQSLLMETSDSASQPSRDNPPQTFLLPQRPTTLPSSPRRPLTTALSPGKPSPASLRSPHQEVTTPSVLSFTPSPAPSSTPAPSPSVLTTPRKSSSSSSTPSRSYMSPTASSMAKMSRSVSVGDGLNDPADEPSPAPPPAPPPPVAVVTSNTATVVPVVVSSSSSASLAHSNHGNQAGRILQARISGSSRPLPDKPTLASFSPSTRTNAAGLSSSSSSSSTVTHPPPVSVSPLIPPPKEEEPQTPAGSAVDNSAVTVTMETCRALTNELQSCFRRATHLYRKVSASSADDSAPDQHQMAVVLSEAFQAMRAELDSLPLSPPGTLGVEGGLGGVGEVKMAALLEEYSLLLLQAVQRRLPSPTN